EVQRGAGVGVKVMAGDHITQGMSSLQVSSLQGRVWTGESEGRGECGQGRVRAGDSSKAGKAI
ncbi:unnamed protein product, partial [Closterium sp. NIES-53]